MFSPEVLWAIGVIALAAVMVWAMRQYARRDRGKDPQREAATRALYDDAGKSGPLERDSADTTRR